MEFADESEIALSISKGVSSPSSVNPDLLSRKVTKRKPLASVSEMLDGIRKCDRVVLAQAITLVESNNLKHYEIAQELVQACLPFAGNSIRIGITGVPGAGKSTLIESFGLHLCEKHQRKIAVLAVDPSSKKSGGSILGDKTRMSGLAARQDVFIRPSPSTCALGGVADKTRETMLLCEAAGYDTLLIETVGVGQSEITVHGMVDFFLLLMISGAGDELQGIKRGIMEMADGIVITKADGKNINAAESARTQYQNAVHYFPRTIQAWSPRVLTASATENKGMQGIWEMILEFESTLRKQNVWESKRAEQLKAWMQDSIAQSLKHDFYEHPSVKEGYGELETQVLQAKLSPFQAARKLLDHYLNGQKP
jgi:LAO/AO transport system kinase